MKYDYHLNSMGVVVKTKRRVVKQDRQLQDIRRRRMLTVDQNARMATVFGATFVL